MGILNIMCMGYKIMLKWELNLHIMAHKPGTKTFGGYDILASSIPLFLL